MEKFIIKPATPQDTSLILSFIKELADYEKLLHEVMATEAILKTGFRVTDNALDNE